MKALFLGGSFTADGGLPEQFSSVFRFTTGGKCQVAAHTFRQAKLLEHLSSEESNRLVDSCTWDLVILQEQSKLPIDDPETTFEAIRKWQCRVPPGTLLVIMMTWRRKEDFTNADRWTRHLRFFRQVHSAGVCVSPVGIAWEIFRGALPHCDLMQPDSSHATWLGAQLSAVCLFETVLRSTSKTGVRLHTSHAMVLASSAAHEFFREDIDVDA